MDQKISKKIREIRKNKNITLKELSDKTDLSVSFLSQVERGLSSMTITTLSKIAGAMNVPMTELVDVAEGGNSFISKKDPQKLNIERSFISYMPVGGKFDGRKLEGLILTMKPQCDDQEMMTHEGEELYYIIRGEGTFIIDGEEYTAGPGEVVHYPSILPHRTINKKDEELVMLCVTTPTIF